MRYNENDIEEFKIYIEGLLKGNLIRQAKCARSSPTFFNRSHSEIKGGKARMVINHKQLNQ